MQDIVGPASFWPQRIRRSFWTRNYFVALSSHHNSRLRLD